MSKASNKGSRRPVQNAPWCNLLHAKCIWYCKLQSHSPSPMTPRLIVGTTCSLWVGENLSETCPTIDWLLTKCRSGYLSSINRYVNQGYQSRVSIAIDNWHSTTASFSIHDPKFIPKFLCVLNFCIFLFLIKQLENNLKTQVAVTVWFSIFSCI